MSRSLRILDRFNELPRAMQWLAVAVVATALFLFWHDVLYGFKRDWDDQAAAIQHDVMTVRRGEQYTQQLRKVPLNETVVGIGTIEPPDRTDQGRKAMADAVNAVLSGELAMPHSFDLSESTLPREASTGVVDGSQRLRTISGELSFETTPEKAIAVVHALERRPEIESVNTVRLVKTSDGKLKVNLGFDTWVIASGSLRP